LFEGILRCGFYRAKQRLTGSIHLPFDIFFRADPVKCRLAINKSWVCRSSV
jgi:hypothetical protein